MFLIGGNKASGRLGVVVAKTEATDDLDAESEPPPTPSSYGMASDDLMDVRDVDDDVLLDRSQSRTPVVNDTATLSYAALTLSTVTPPPQDGSKKRERKPRETRRLVRNGFTTSPNANGNLSNVPEQTEPEDLSMTSSAHLSTVSSPYSFTN